MTLPSPTDGSATLRDRHLFEHNPVPLWVHARHNLQVLDANAAFRRLFGYALTELQQLDLLALLPPNEHLAATHPRAFSDELTRRENGLPFEQLLVGKSGVAIWTRVHLTALPDLPGQPAGILGSATEITDKKDIEARLHRSIARLEATLESINDGFFTLDREWRFTYLNSEAERILHRERHALLGRVIWEEYPEAVGSVFEHAYRRALTENQAQRFEAYYPPLDTWFGIHAYPAEDGLTVYFRDVTPGKADETALGKSEERFRLLAKATNDAVWDWDLTTQELWWNDGIEILFGFSREEIGTGIASWSKRIHPEDHAAVVVDIDAALARGDTVWACEYRFLRKDGTYAHVLDRGHILRDPDGTPLRMIGGMTDRTESRRAAERIAEQAALLDQARDAILVRDLDHQILYWNRGAERLYGWTADEAVGSSIKELLYRDPGTFLAATSAALTNGEWVGELEQITKAGHVLAVEARWTLMRDAEGAPKAILAINTDITERKKIELQFMRAQRMESIGTLAGGIAHDLNNLLSPIIMGVDLLRQLDPHPRAVGVLDNIGRSAKRGAELVRQVLSFARGVEGTRVSLQISHLLRELGSIVANTFPKNIRFERRVAADLWTVVGDPTQLNQVLLNLCVNARDAMPDGGRLVLEARNVEIDQHYAAMDRGITLGRYVVIQVSDEGTGMSKEVQERAFEPFFTTKELGKGTGLGLSTALGIVRGHGGFFNVYSEVGKGSVFKIHLPAQTDRTDSTPSLPDREALPRGQGECILVVDDESSILSITKQTLETFGYRVIVAEDGARALALYTGHRSEIALVLTDMMMPIMDGPALIAALRRLDPSVRIIAASGLNANGNMAKGGQAGARHFLAKPYSADRLLTLLRTVLAEPA